MNGGHDYKTEAHSYYEYKDIDREFYQEYLKDFLPREIFDTHVHLALPEHFYPVSSERKFEDWALGVGYNLSVEAVFFAYAELFPGKKVNILGFPFPIKEAKLDEINRYVCSYINKGRIKGLMATHPDWAYEKVKEELQENNFLGIKPYPDLVTKVKGADLPILFMKGKREWEGDRYINYSSGNYLWNTKRKPSEEEARYTFFLYEEIKALRCSIESLNMGTKAVEAIFYKNAKEIFEK